MEAALRSFLRRSAGVLGAVVVLSSAACTDGGPEPSALTVDDHRSDVLGVGVTTGGSAADLREIMCVKVTGDPAATVRRLREVLRDGSAQEGTAWSKLLPGATVEQTGDGVVRLTAPSDAPAGLGILLRALFRNDLPNWRV